MTNNKYQFKNRFVLYADILGFSQAVKNAVKKKIEDNDDEDFNKLTKLRNKLLFFTNLRQGPVELFSEEDKKNNTKDYFTRLSRDENQIDNKFAFADSFIVVENCDKIKDALRRIEKKAQEFSSICLGNGFLFRGVINYGPLCYEKTEHGEKPIFELSPAYIDAVKMEQCKTNWQPRIIILTNELKKAKEKEWLNLTDASKTKNLHDLMTGLDTIDWNTIYKCKDDIIYSKNDDDLLFIRQLTTDEKDIQKTATHNTLTAKKEDEDFYYLNIFHKQFCSHRDSYRIDTKDVINNVTRQYNGNCEKIKQKHKWLQDEIKLQSLKNTATDKWGEIKNGCCLTL